MSKIEWLAGADGAPGKTWNPVVGCTRVSAGCDHCYAMGVAHRKMQPSHYGLTKLRPKHATRPGVDWTGTVRCLPDRLNEPLRWRKPRRVFVNSMSDLFHSAVPFDFIDRVFARMLITSLRDAAVGRHTYLVLTKRPQSALEYLTSHDLASRLGREAGQTMEDGDAWGDSVWQHVDRNGPTHPLIQLGVSAEDQETFDERVPVLLRCRAAVRWVSAEPLLGPLDDLRPWLPHAFNREPHCPWCEECVSGGPRARWTETREDNHGPFLDWVVAGGESGAGARNCDPAWIRSIVRQCNRASVPVFVKQLGSYGRRGKGDDLEEFPADLRVREYSRSLEGS